jgi:hypothetical protein
MAADHVRNAHTVRSSSLSSSGEEQSYSSGDEAGVDSNRVRSGNTSNRAPPKRLFFRRQTELIWNSQPRSGVGAEAGQHAWDEEDIEPAVRAVEHSFVDLGMGRKRRYDVGIMNSWKPGPDDSP